MRFRVPVFLSLCVLLACACAHPPPREHLANDWDAAALKACPAEPSAAALQAAAPDPAQRDYARRVACLETSLSGAPLVGGNRVTLLVDGPATHDAQLEAIAQARHHVHLAVYIFTDDQVGQRYLDAFTKLHRRGVKVRVLVDAVGARGMSDDFQHRMQDAGVELFVSGPQNPAEDPKNWQLSHRNHRKLLVIDGRIAFTGGVNISDQYQQEPGASKTTAGWRDTNLRIEGPAVAEFQKLFIADWEAGRGALESLAGVASHEESRDNSIYASYLVAISESRQRVWITQAYFAPNRGFVEALKAAAARGVDVRLLVPGYTDIGAMLHASRSHYQGLLEAGIHVYEYSRPEAVLHAKTAVIDGVWATVGSSNLDYRSFIHNDEANAIVIGADFAQQMEQMYRDDLASSKEITREEWQRRGLRERTLEDLSVLFKYWI